MKVSTVFWSILAVYMFSQTFTHIAANEFWWAFMCGSTCLLDVLLAWKSLEDVTPEVKS